jgi:hypothetical protein
MERPDLDRMWETWIKIGPSSNLTQRMLWESIRNTIYPIVSDLEKRKIIDWYHFLFHPNPHDPENAYFHLRFSVPENVREVRDMALPSYCAWPEKIAPIKNIAGIDERLLIGEEIEEAWRLIGEQSEWIIDLVRTHKQDIPDVQFVQFMHFFMNMMGLGMRSIFPIWF